MKNEPAGSSIKRSPSWSGYYDGRRPFKTKGAHPDTPEECALCRLRFTLCDGPDFQGLPGADCPIAVRDPGETCGWNLAHRSCVRKAAGKDPNG